VGNFLRFAALILLVLIGFGGGICGVFGLGAVAVEQLTALYCGALGLAYTPRALARTES